jgi:hypothetical protein
MTSVGAELRFRVCLRLLTAPHGAKEQVARRLAAELGRGVRTLFRWQRQYKEFGSEGLDRRRRADKGSSHLYGPNEISRVAQAAWRIRRRGDLTREWRAAGLPGSYSTFVSQVRAMQAAGYVHGLGRPQEAQSA